MEEQQVFLTLVVSRMYDWVGKSLSVDISIGKITCLTHPATVSYRSRGIKSSLTHLPVQ